jgi:SAM-dependent methyltransferase
MAKQSGTSKLSSSNSIIDKLKSFVKKHPSFYAFALNFLSPVLATGKSHALLLKLVPDGEIIVNLGSGPTSLSERHTNVDFHHYGNVHVIADVHDIPLKSESVSGVVSVAMLEHVRNTKEVVAEMYRVLKPGGYIYAVVPFIFGYHSAPQDYYRWTAEGMKNMFGEFREIETGVYSGPTSSMLIILQEWLAMLLSFRIGILYQLLYLVFMILLAPFKIIDFYLHKHPAAHKTAATLYYIGRKELN